MRSADVYDKPDRLSVHPHSWKANSNRCKQAQLGLQYDSTQQMSFTTKTNISPSFLMTQPESGPKYVAFLNHFRGILSSLRRCQVTPGSHKVRVQKIAALAV